MELMPKLGLDEQKPDTRPVVLGNAAMDADARCSSGSTAGRSGEARGKDSKLNLGDLTVCPDDPDYCGGNVVGWAVRSQQRP
jgi:hypothetical protein